jgi:hypothetical protein
VMDIAALHPSYRHNLNLPDSCDRALLEMCRQHKIEFRRYVARIARQEMQA